MIPCSDSEHQWVTFSQLFSFGSLTQFQRCKKCGATRTHHPYDPDLDCERDYVEGCE